MSADMSKATDAQIQAQLVKDGNEITRLRAERAELLTALRRTTDKLEVFIKEHDDPGADALATVFEARAALAKAEER